MFGFYDEILRTGSSLKLDDDRSHSSSLIAAAHTSSTHVGIVSWQTVLTTLENALDDPASEPYWDIQQLRAMCEHEDRRAFVPFASYDLESRAGQRILDFIRLVDDLVEDLVADSTASINGLRPSATRDGTGRYLLLAGWVFYLGVSWTNWASQRPTPIWLLLTDLRASGYPLLTDALTPLRTDNPPRLLFDSNRPLVPIYLLENVDRDQVRAAMADQVREVAALLKKCPPPDADSDAR